MEVEGAYKAECKKHSVSVLSAKLKEVEEFPISYKHMGVAEVLLCN